MVLEQDPVAMLPSAKRVDESEEEGLMPVQKVQESSNQNTVVSPVIEMHELPDTEMKPDLSVPSTEYSEDVLVKPAEGSEYPPMVEEYVERLAIMNRRNPPFKKDYKEATKSLYTSALLTKIGEMKENEEEKQLLLANANVEGLEQGTEFLDRNPRCRIVLFDGCTMGLEASVRLQNCSIVAAMIGRMMLMEEYLKYANPASEYVPSLDLTATNFLFSGTDLSCFSITALVITVWSSIQRPMEIFHAICVGHVIPTSRY